MRFLYFLSILLITASCGPEPSNTEETASSVPEFQEITTSRFTVKNGDLDSLNAAGFIVEYYNADGEQTKSAYLTSDRQVMMQFVNHWENGLKVRVDWVNAEDTLTQYVQNEYNDQAQLIKSVTYSTDGVLQYGFESEWEEDGQLEKKGPLEEGVPFKPNAFYRYDEQQNPIELREFDAQDSLYAVVRWKYTQKDENGQWLERQMITNDTINRVERREIIYRN